VDPRGRNRKFLFKRPPLGQVRYSTEVFHRALQWAEGHVECVWTARKLKILSYDIDHCFPWSRWDNNDLWNLLPASHLANAAKSEKL